MPLRAAARAAWVARWSGLLALAAQRAIAASLLELPRCMLMRSWPMCAGSSLCLTAARDPDESLVLAPFRRTRKVDAFGDFVRPGKKGSRAPAAPNHLGADHNKALRNVELLCRLLPPRPWQGPCEHSYDMPRNRRAPSSRPPRALPARRARGHGGA